MPLAAHSFSCDTFLWNFSKVMKKQCFLVDKSTSFPINFNSTALVKERFVHQPFSDDAPNLINPSPELKLKWAKNLGDAIKIQV
jgi:hypothetical protein